MKNCAATLLIGILLTSTCISQSDLAKPIKINNYYCWDIANTDKIIQNEIAVKECDSLYVINLKEKKNLENQIRVADSLQSNLQQQLNNSMQMNIICTNQKTEIINDYHKLQTENESLILKNNRRGKTIKGLSIGGGIAVAILLTIAYIGFK